MAKPRKLPLNVLLQAIDRRDLGWLSRQAEDVRKEFSAVTAIRFASNADDGVDAGVLLWTINQRVNRHLFDLHQHPDLSYRLLASCGLKRSVPRGRWLAGPRRSTDNAALRLLADYHPAANERELRLLLALYSRTEFAQFLSDCDIDEPEKYLSAYDKLS